MPYRLRVRFEDPERFREEFERNLAMGGAFVPTPDPVQLRALVELEVELAWADVRHSLEAQVVHTVPLERALKPLEAGVIVAFVAPTAELRETLAPQLDGADGGAADSDHAGAAPSAPGGADAALGPTTTFEVRVQRIDSERLSVLEASVLELATAGIALERILEVIPEADADVRHVLQTLVEQGILSVP